MRCKRQMRSFPGGDDSGGAGAGADPARDLFVTETMAELSARQGRLADAASIYRRLLAGAASDDRRARWQLRLAALEVELVAGPAGAASARPVATSAAATTTTVQGRDARATRGGEPPAPPPALPSWELPLLIDRPVRSGQIVYAEGRDLIVLAPVNPGAQLLADGHIHVYAPLRGRAVAGVRGCAQAQIFCQRFEAELVGIDAAYTAAEDLPADLQGKAVRIWLDGGVCRFARLATA
jgi:septum formation inhibitor MinC